MTLVISGSLALGTSITALPLTHPRIGYENLLRGADCTITPSTEATDHEADNIVNGLTWSYWEPTAVTATLTFTFDAAKDVDYFGIAAHTLDTYGFAIELEYLDNSSPATWVSLGEVLPADTDGNGVIMFLFDEVSSDNFRLTITGGTGNPAIGVVYLGKVLEVERRIYGGHSPITLSKNTVIRPNKSEGGQWLGRTIIRQGASTSIALKNLTPTWIRATFKPFIEAARSYPFFWAWRPGDYADEIGYVWTDADISPQNSGQAGLMDVSFEVKGFIE
ncbi:MAG: hypothetical protein PHU14_12790 [Methylovulum sp.]|nr:hypothetical protein [Methylovulum sp.]